MKLFDFISNLGSITGVIVDLEGLLWWGGGGSSSVKLLSIGPNVRLGCSYNQSC